MQNTSSKVLETIDSIYFYRSIVSVVNRNKELVYFPKLNSGKYPISWQNFNTWAESPVFIYNISPEQRDTDGLIYVHEVNKTTQFVLNRLDIISFYRHQFGAHSGLKMEEKMYKIAAGLASIEYLDHPRTKYLPGERYKPGKPAKYLFETAIRQIAHELILSIKREFNFSLPYKPLISNYLGKNVKHIPDILISKVRENERGEKQIQITDL